MVFPPGGKHNGEKSGFQKETMSVSNHVSALDHWAYSQVKIDLLSMLRVFGLQALIRPQITYMSIERNSSLGRGN